MEIFNIGEAKTQLSALVKKALAGEEIFIAHAGQPVVRLTPAQPAKEKRVGGLWKGQIFYEEDSTETDREIAESFYASPIFPDEEK